MLLHFFLQDLSSRNGLLWNGKFIKGQKLLLSPGDTIELPPGGQSESEIYERQCIALAELTQSLTSIFRIHLSASSG